MIDDLNFISSYDDLKADGFTEVNSIFGHPVKMMGCEYEASGRKRQILYEFYKSPNIYKFCRDHEIASVSGSVFEQGGGLNDRKR
jgi:hypothetical protein